MAVRNIGWLESDTEVMAIAGIVNAEEGGFITSAIVAERQLRIAHMRNPEMLDNYAFSADYGVPVEGEMEFEVASTYTW